MSLKTIWNAIALGIERAGRSRARRELLALSDRSLADSGLSRALLEQGISAWPWQEAAEEPARWNVAALRGPHEAAGEDTSSAIRKAEYARAVAALRRYTDAELSDLGVGRGAIEEAVRHGRPGIDEVSSRAA